MLLNTENGGNTWDIKPLESHLDFNAMQFTSPTQAIVVGDSGVIYSTQNGGENWHSQKSNTKKNILTKMKFSQ